LKKWDIQDMIITVFGNLVKILHHMHIYIMIIYVIEKHVKFNNVFKMLLLILMVKIHLKHLIFMILLYNVNNLIKIQLIRILLIIQKKILKIIL